MYFCINFNFFFLPWLNRIYNDNSTLNVAVWNVSKYGVFTGPYFNAFGPEKTLRIWILFTQCVANRSTFRGQYSLRNNRTLPCEWRAFGEYRNKFSFMLPYIFYDLFKVEPKWIFVALVVLVLITDNLDQIFQYTRESSFLEYPNRYPIWVTHLSPSVFSWTVSILV